MSGAGSDRCATMEKKLNSSAQYVWISNVGEEKFKETFQVTVKTKDETCFQPSLLGPNIEGKGIG